MESCDRGGVIPFSLITMESWDRDGVIPFSLITMESWDRGGGNYFITYH